MKNGNGHTLTRSALQEAVYASCVGLSRVEARKILEMFFEEIFEALVRGERVKLELFGSFHVRSKQARVGRNPRTGKEAPIVRRKVLRFKASSALVAQINGKAVGEADG